MSVRDPLGNLLEKIVLRSSASPIKTLLILFGITLVAGWIAWGIELDPTILNLTPKDRPVVQEYVNHELDFSHTEFMISVIETPKNLPLIRYRRFIKEYQKRLSEIPQVDPGRLTFDKKLAKDIQGYINQHALMLMSPQDLIELNQLLSPEQIQTKLKLSNPYRHHLWKQTFDPLELLSFISGLSPLTENTILDRSKEFFITKDSRTVFFMVGIDSPWFWNETAKIVDQAAKIEKQVWDEVMPQIKSMNPEQDIAYPKITWVGKAMDVLRLTHALHDSFRGTVLWTSLLTAIVFLFFFRNFRSMVLAYLPLFIGLIWSFACARILVGKLNMLSIMVGATLIGLGIDFPSYLLNQYFQQKEKGGSLRDALVVTWRKTGRFVFFGALTTMVTFSILGLSRLPAFRDIAIITSAGLLLTLTAVLTALPALIALTEKWPLPKRMWRYPNWLIQWPVRKPKTTVLVSFLFLGILICFVTQFRFASALQEAYYMFKQPGEMVTKDYQRYSSLFGSSLVPLRLIIQGEHWEELLKKNEKLFDLLKKYQDQEKIAYFDSLYYLLPSRSRQEQMTSLLESLENLNVERFSSEYDHGTRGFLTSKTAPRERKQGYKIYGKALKELLKGRKPVLPSDLQDAGLGKILKHYLAEKSGHRLLSTYVYLPQGDYLSQKKALLADFQQEKMFADGEVKYSSEESVINEIRTLVLREIPWLAGLALIVTTVLLYFGLRSFKKTILTLIPMILGGGAALGAYTLLWGSFSIFNLMLIPIYIGMSTDDALHLGEELEHDDGQGDAIAKALRKWGGMIILTSVTNMIGFGSNLFTDIEVLKRIGVWIMLALGCELIGSMFMLPALFKLFLHPAKNHLPKEISFGTGLAQKN